MKQVKTLSNRILLYYGMLPQENNNDLYLYIQNLHVCMYVCMYVCQYALCMCMAVVILHATRARRPFLSVKDCRNLMDKKNYLHTHTYIHTYITLLYIHTVRDFIHSANYSTE